MNLDENAEITYQPDDEPSGGSGIKVAFAEAERQLAKREGVNGLGMSKTPAGQDAIVVYVKDKQALSQLPKVVNGIPIVGEITGEIKAL